METSELLEAWYGGEDEALDLLLDQHLPTIRAMVRKRITRSLRQKEESCDLVQEALIRFLRSRPMVRIVNTRVFRAFFVRVIENVLRDKHDFYTAQRRSPARDEPLPSQGILDLETPSMISSKEEQREWVRLGVEFLEDLDRDVIILKGWKDQSIAEIGKLIGMTEDGARKRHRAAMIRLGEIVDKLRNAQLPELLKETGALES